MHQSDSHLKTVSPPSQRGQGMPKESGAKRRVVLEVQPAKIPQKMKELPQWLNWRRQKIVTKAGKEEWKEPPVDSEGRRIDITKPQNWTTFEKAYAAYSTGRYD